MKYTYNQTKHIELLKRSQDFKNQGRSFDKESREEYLELLSYDGTVYKMILWQQRHKIQELMEDFLNKKIDGEEFCGGVFGLRRTLMIESDQFLVQLAAGEVKNFQPDPRVSQCSGFLDSLFCYCDDFMEDYENDQFITAMQNGFLNFQEALNEE